MPGAVVSVPSATAGDQLFIVAGWSPVAVCLARLYGAPDLDDLLKEKCFPLVCKIKSLDGIAATQPLYADVSNLVMLTQIHLLAISGVSVCGNTGKKELKRMTLRISTCDTVSGDIRSQYFAF